MGKLFLSRPEFIGTGRSDAQKIIYYAARHVLRLRQLIPIINMPPGSSLSASRRRHAQMMIILATPTFAYEFLSSRRRRDISAAPPCSIRLHFRRGGG